jgi:hypothetical protein
MVQQLQWEPLQVRRVKIRLVLLYKIQQGLVAIPAETYLVPGDTRTIPGYKSGFVLSQLVGCFLSSMGPMLSRHIPRLVLLVLDMLLLWLKICNLSYYRWPSTQENVDTSFQQAKTYQRSVYHPWTHAPRSRLQQISWSYHQ